MILVIGGTGQVGRRIVELLHRQGSRTRVLTRDPARPGRSQVDGVEFVVGDLLRRDSLVAALDGVDVVVCTAHGGRGSRANGPRGIEGRGLPQLIEVARDSALKQFVYLSTASARPDSPSDFFRSKAHVEAALRSSGVPHAILRPTHLLDTWVPMLAEPLVTKSRAMIIGAGNNPVSWVAGWDIAQAAAALAGETGSGYTAELGGPGALTLRQLNGLVEHALGVTPKRTSVMSPGMLRAGSRMMRPFNELMARQMRLGALLDTLPQVVDSTVAWRRLGVTPSTVTDWLDANLAGLVAR
jgi:uncharacterized protein YbjT (DUF2867 family)